MDWHNEPYVRLYTRKTADDAELSWEALAVWRALLCEFDRSGLFAVRNGWASVAKAIRIPADVVERAGIELVRDGRVRMIESGVYAPNFVAAQTASKSDKLRQQESRDRRRAQAESMPNTVSSDHVAPISGEDASSTLQNVTTGHGQSQDVTQCHSLLCSADPLLSHCDAVLTLGAQDAPSNVEPPKPRKRATQLPEAWEPKQRDVEKAKSAGLDIDNQLFRFRNHHTAKGSTFKDWDAAFRTWISNAIEWGQGRKPQVSGTEYARRVALGEES